MGTASDIIPWLAHGDPLARRLATLAPLALDAAEAGDEAARAIAAEATRLLTSSAVAASTTPDVVLHGGLTDHAWFRAQLTDALAAAGRRVRPPVGDAIDGALLLATRFDLLTKGSCTVPNDDTRLTALIEELSKLDTEAATTERGDLDLLTSAQLVERMNAEDARVAGAVAAEAAQIAAAVDGITERFRRGGRLIYIGAGTAGRIGVLDASECPPTFGTDPSLVVGIIAGGETAIRSAVENAEDDADAAAASLAELQLTASDTVVGISASGRTPYVIGGLDYARGLGALTVAIASNRASAIGAAADIAIEVVTGPEFISGSTRLKSGTAQKLVVNMLTTLSMIKLGKTYRGVMVDLLATNEKLHARSIRTVSQLAGVDTDEAARALGAADGSVKLAVLILATGATPADAASALDAAGGLLREAISALS